MYKHTSLKLIIFFSCIFFLPSFNTSAQQGAIIKNGEGLLSYKTFGYGKPLLLINGGPGMNSNGFEGIARLLSKNNLVIIYDQRGTGRSTIPKINSSSISMDLMLQDIELLRKHLKIDRWIIMGHSFGGMLASYYATIFPNNIEAMILSSSGGIDLGLLSYVGNNINKKLSSVELDSLNYYNGLLEAGDSSHQTRLKRGMLLAPAYVVDRKYIPVIAERLTEGNSLINGLVWNDMRKIKFDCRKKLADFNKPVLIIQGKNDIIEEKTAMDAKNAFKNSTVVFIDHAGHYGWLDNEQEYISAIEKFLQQKN